MNAQVAMSTALLQAAIKGNVRAYEVIRDTIGEKPVERMEAALTDADFILRIVDDSEGDE